MGAAYMRPLRAIVGVHRPPPPGADCVANEAVLYELRVAHPVWLLIFARLRLAAKLVRKAPSFVVAAAQGVGGAKWRSEVCDACAAIKALLPRLLAELPCPNTDMRAWVSLWSLEPSGWRDLLRRGKHQAGADPLAAARCLQLIPSLAKYLPFKDPEAGNAAPDELLCHLCGKWCIGEVGLAAHSHWVHAAQGPLAKACACLIGTVCPCCNADFRSRIRLLRHCCHGAGACVTAVQSGILPSLPAEVVAAADAADTAERATRRKSGHRDHEGPTYRPAAAPAPAPALAPDGGADGRGCTPGAPALVGLVLTAGDVPPGHRVGQ